MLEYMQINRLPIRLSKKQWLTWKATITNVNSDYGTLYYYKIRVTKDGVDYVWSSDKMRNSYEEAYKDASEFLDVAKEIDLNTIVSNHLEVVTQYGYKDLLDPNEFIRRIMS